MIEKLTSIDAIDSVRETDVFKPKITVLGIGGSGTNALNNMIGMGLHGVKFVVMNTDAQSLDKSMAPNKIQLGPSLTKGLGAGSDPNIGMQAAEESAEVIKSVLEGSNMLFITAGMGGGTGTGASQVVTRIAKEMDILTIAFLTKPFAFEGYQRMQIAEEGIQSMEQQVDSLIVLSNQNIFKVIDSNTSLAEAFKKVDNVLYLGIKSITELMISPGLVNLDFNDIKSVVHDMGRTVLGFAQANGEDRAYKVAEDSMFNPLLEYQGIMGAKKVLINITGGEDMTLHEVDIIIGCIKQNLDPEAFINFGTIHDEDADGYIKVYIVATGLSDDYIAPTDSSYEEIDNTNESPLERLKDHKEANQGTPSEYSADNWINIKDRLQVIDDDLIEEVKEVSPSTLQGDDLPKQELQQGDSSNLFNMIIRNKKQRSDQPQTMVESEVISIKNRNDVNKSSNKEESLFDLPSFLKKK